MTLQIFLRQFYYSLFEMGFGPHRKLKWNILVYFFREKMSWMILKKQKNLRTLVSFVTAQDQWLENPCKSPSMIKVIPNIDVELGSVILGLFQINTLNIIIYRYKHKVLLSHMHFCFYFLYSLIIFFLFTMNSKSIATVAIYDAL
jgi:hypothetical protein